MSTTQQKTLSIDGMHCEHCVEVVRQALGKIENLTVEDVEVGAARVAYDSSGVTEQQLAAAIDDAGYELREAS